MMYLHEDPSGQFREKQAMVYIDHSMLMKNYNCASNKKGNTFDKTLVRWSGEWICGTLIKRL